MDKTEELPKPARIEIQGENGIILKQLVQEDAQAYFELIEFDRAHLSQTHSGVRDGTADKYQTVEDVLDSILHPKDPNKIRFGIWVNGVMVGSNNLTPSPEEPHKVESGSLVSKKYKGHHYAALARELLVEFALDQLGYTEVFSDIAVGNEASRKSVEKSGFAYNGVIQKDDEEGIQRPYWQYVFRR